MAFGRGLDTIPTCVDADTFSDFTAATLISINVYAVKKKFDIFSGRIYGFGDMIQVLGYKGTSKLSLAIRLLTYSEYSHIALQFTEELEVEFRNKIVIIPAGTVFEAWAGGVRMAATASENHKERTRVDAFQLIQPLSRLKEKQVARFLLGNVGKAYDYLNVIRFLPIVRLIVPRPASMFHNRNHVFCSELALEAFATVNRPLLVRCNNWEVPPRDPPRSPLLRPVGSFTT